MIFFKKFFASIFLSIFFIPQIVFASTDSCVYYFFSQDCLHCKSSTYFVDTLSREYKNLEVHKFDIWRSTKNKIFLEDIASKYNISERQIPIAVIGSEYFVGAQDIIENLENKINANQKFSCPALKDKNYKQSELIKESDHTNTYILLFLGVVVFVLSFLRQKKIL